MQKPLKVSLQILASSLPNTGYHETPFPELAIHDTNVLLAYSDALHMWYKDIYTYQYRMRRFGFFIILPHCEIFCMLAS